MTSEKVANVIDRQHQDIARDCFGHWITSIWSKYDENFSFAENNEGFFYLIGRLIADGKVAFDHPRKTERWKAHVKQS